MFSDPPTIDVMVPAIYPAQLIRMVTTRWGIDPQKLLEGAGLVDADLQDPDARIEGIAMNRLALRALELTKEPGLGFYFGLHVKLSSHGSVGFAAMTSATLRNALDVGARYYTLRTGHATMDYRVEGDTAIIEFADSLPQGPLRQFFLEALMTEFSQMARSLTGETIPGRFEVRHAEPRHFQGFAHLLAGPVRFSQAADRFLFPATYLDLPLVFADELQAASALERCEHEYATLDVASNFLSGVRRQMKGRSIGFPTLTELADRRHVSERTMKRQLAAHGTSFQKLLDELRRDRAIALLGTKGTSVERVAEVLGYADPSNFNRAFKRWMGVAPSQFRESTQARESAKSELNEAEERAPRSARGQSTSASATQGKRS